MNSLIISSAFQRAVKRLSAKGVISGEDLGRTLHLLEEDAWHPSLKTHKLKGEFEGHWACSLGYDLRVIFRFVEHEGRQAVLLETMGTHDEVY